MQAIAERFGVYIEKHAEYKRVMGKVEQLHNSNVSLEKELHKKQNELLEITSRKDKIETEKMHLKKELDNQKLLYAECTDPNASLKPLFKKNEFADPIEFQRGQDKIREKYEKSLDEYYVKRKNVLEQKKIHIIEEEKAFDQNSRDFVKTALEKIYAGCANIISEKKEDVLRYLNANETIQNSEITKSIIRTVEKNDMSWCISMKSEGQLIKDVIALKGTEEYVRTQEFDLAEFKKQREKALDIVEVFRQFGDGRSKYQSKIFLPFLGIVAIIFLIVFMMGFTPMSFIIPSSTTIAEASQTVAQYIVRIVVSCLGGVVVGVVGYYVLKFFGLDIGAKIGGGMAGIYIFWMIFTVSYPKITTQNMMGFGKVIHWSIALLLNLVLVAAIIVFLYGAILNTQIAELFFTINDDAILTDLNTFYEYFLANKELYLVMFHVDEVFTCIYKNRFKSQIKETEKDLNKIREEESYLQIKNECELKLFQRSEKRKKQLNDIKGRERELEEQIKKKTALSNSIQANLINLGNAISDLKTQLVRDKRLEDILINKIDENKRYLLEETEFIIDKNEGEFEEKCLKLNTSKELLNCNGKLSNQLFFVRKIKDQYGMAEVKKMDIKCEHTVFLYDKDDLKGNNLSEELCNFIKWFIDAVRRTTPATLLYRWFTVIDIVSGQSVLTMPPYDKYIKVVGDEKGKLAVAKMLSNKMESVVAEMSRIGTEGELIDNVDILNGKKMAINKTDIEQHPNIAIQELWEELIPYHILIFIVPEVIENGGQPSVLNDDLKKVLMNSEHYGIIPVFIIAKETWKNTKGSSDVAYLHNIPNKSVMTIYNVGKDKGELLDF